MCSCGAAYYVSRKAAVIQSFLTSNSKHGIRGAEAAGRITLRTAAMSSLKKQNNICCIVRETDCLLVLNPFWYLREGGTIVCDIRHVALQDKSGYCLNLFSLSPNKTQNQSTYVIASSSAAPRASELSTKYKKKTSINRILVLGDIVLPHTNSLKLYLLFTHTASRSPKHSLAPNTCVWIRRQK